MTQVAATKGPVGRSAPPSGPMPKGACVLETCTEVSDGCIGGKAARLWNHMHLSWASLVWAASGCGSSRKTFRRKKNMIYLMFGGSLLLQNDTSGCQSHALPTGVHVGVIVHHTANFEGPLSLRKVIASGIFVGTLYEGQAFEKHDR